FENEDEGYFQDPEDCS
nr:RecName: Full=Venom peptide OcyTx1 [Opisthacanthus cayaporum]